MDSMNSDQPTGELEYSASEHGILLRATYDGSPVTDVPVPPVFVNSVEVTREEWNSHRTTNSSGFPALCHYTIPKRNRLTVSEFLTHYCGAEPDTANAMFIVDVSGPGFQGAVLVLLRTVMDWTNPTLFASCGFDGEAILIPANHDPWAMVGILCEKDYIDFTATYKPPAWVEGLCYDTYIAAHEHMHKPTMIKIQAPELLWIAWSLHLEPILRDWDTELANLYGIGEYMCHRAPVLAEGRRIVRGPGYCDSLVHFSRRLLVEEAKYFLEEDINISNLVSPTCSCHPLRQA